MKERMRILGIETSCDETAVAVLRIESQVASRKSQVDRFNIRVLQNLVSSQIPIHRKYGGVVPEVAARSHVPETVALLTEAMGLQPEAAGLQPPGSLRSPSPLSGGYRSAPPDKGGRGVSVGFDAIAVTRGPGLATALSVGVEAAKTLAFLTGKPIIGVNHLEGHLASAWLNEENRKHWKFPLLALIVSGGHTELVLMKDFCKYQIIGETRDDAAGEAFDKSAKLMGLPYPGGPEIAKAAQGGDPKAFAFPRPMLHDGTFDFSFSGLKTAVRQEWEKELKVESRKSQVFDFAASLQQAIVDVLVEKTIKAAQAHRVNGILLVGGVSANAELRRQMGERIERDLKDVAFLPSDRAYITDNAAMIAAAGYWRLMRGEKHDWKKLDADPELELSRNP